MEARCEVSDLSILKRQVFVCRNGRFSTVCPGIGIKLLSGEYRDGELLGPGRIVFNNNQVIIANFSHGSIHGLARRFSSSGEVLWIGRYEFGRPEGTCWQCLPGGGLLTGQVSQTRSGPADSRDDTISGDNVTYIFPDYKTCLTGTFTQSRLVEAKLARIINIEEQEVVQSSLSSSDPDQSQGVINIQTETISDYIYSFSSTFSQTDFLARDPYEASLVEVRESRLEGAGEGVFVMRTVPSNTVLAFYNGERSSSQADDDVDWDICSYRIFIDKEEDGEEGEEEDCDILDIPEGLRSVEKYCATVGHKINHSFSPNCVFRPYHHPLHGYIKCLVSSQEITEDQELTVDYKYPL